MKSKRLFVAMTLVVSMHLIAIESLLAQLPQTEKNANSSPNSLARVREKLASNKTVRIACLGDSVTGVYYHTGSRRAYPDMVGLAIRKSFPNASVEVINAGKSGNTTANGLERLDRDVLMHKPDLVTVMFGLNDLARLPLDEFKRNLTVIVEKCRGAGAEVLFATPNNVIENTPRPSAKLKDYCSATQTIGDELGVQVCDIYQHMDSMKTSEGSSWRLLMSDEIHPNMDGHKVIAEQLAESITGKKVTLHDIAPPAFSLERIRSLIAAGKPIRVLAMPPWDKDIEPLLREQLPNASIEITSWPTDDITLEQIEQDANKRVRPLKPDLVVISIPKKTVDSATEDQFVKSFAWVMNWSLNFGAPTWDCIVVHPSVLDKSNSPNERSSLLRRLVRAQDLPLIDRLPGNDDDSKVIMRKSFAAQAPLR